jgi:hypothetical protein
MGARAALTEGPLVRDRLFLALGRRAVAAEQKGGSRTQQNGEPNFGRPQGGNALPCGCLTGSVGRGKLGASIRLHERRSSEGSQRAVARHVTRPRRVNCRAHGVHGWHDQPEATEQERPGRYGDRKNIHAGRSTSPPRQKHEGQPDEDCACPYPYKCHRLVHRRIVGHARRGRRAIAAIRSCLRAQAVIATPRPVLVMVS